MTPEQHRKATPLMVELDKLEKMLANINKSHPVMKMEWGGEYFIFQNYSSPDGCKTLLAAAKTELEARLESLKNQINKI